MNIQTTSISVEMEEVTRKRRSRLQVYLDITNSIESVISR